MLLQLRGFVSLPREGRDPQPRGAKSACSIRIKNEPEIPLVLDFWGHISRFIWGILMEFGAFFTSREDFLSQPGTGRAGRLIWEGRGKRNPWRGFSHLRSLRGTEICVPCPVPRARPSLPCLCCQTHPGTQNTR